MLPVDQDTVERYAQSTRVLRDAVLVLVDAVPIRPLVPSVDSRAMLDQSLESDFASDWSLQPVRRLHFFAASQGFLVAEGAGGIAALYGNDRSFPMVPFYILRPLAEAAGRVMWLLDLDVSMEERIVRTMNVRLDELAGRLKFKGIDQRETSRKLREVQEEGKSLGRDLTKPQGYQRICYVHPAPPSSTQHVKRGLGRSSEYGDPMTQLASAAIHGSTNTLSISMTPDRDSPIGGAQMRVGASSDYANIVMMAAGFSLMDAYQAVFAYWGIGLEGWASAKDGFLRSGREVLRQAGVGRPRGSK